MGWDGGIGWMGRRDREGGKKNKKKGKLGNIWPEKTSNFCFLSP